MKLPARKIRLTRSLVIFSSTLIVVVISSLISIFYLNSTHTQKRLQVENERNIASTKLSSIEKELTALKSQDQVKRNDELQKNIKDLESAYKSSVTVYEKILDAKGNKVNTTKFEEQYADILSMLAEKNYTSASAQLATLQKDLDAQVKKTSGEFIIPTNVAVNNAPPASGYSRQRVKTDIGEYLIDIVSADLSSTKVIIDTASDGDCRENCPVMSLGDYVGRSGAYAGINGSYFCPASYPTCAGKTNSFDTLLMNKNKTYFNSDNNVYSTVPVAVFGNGWARFIGRSLDWGRATDVDGVIANQPLIVSGGNAVFGGDGDPKKGNKGTRSFVGANGTKVYIGVVHNVTVAEMGIVLKTLGLSDALNLDSGGSTALWHGGYKAGPGRAIPNAVLFVRR